MVQSQLREKPGDGELEKRQAQLLKDHKARLLGFVGENDERFRLTWDLGFLKSAWVGLSYESAEEGVELEDLLKEMFAHPSARFLRELRVGLSSFEGDNSYGEVIKLLVELQPEALRSLFLGDFEFPDDTEISWSHIGDASKLWPAFPALEKVVLQSGSMELGKIVLPECRAFHVHTGGLDAASIKSLCSGYWPKLETLEIWFGQDNYGAEGDLKQIQPILEGKGLGNLKHLGLKNAEFTDDIAVALGKSKILKQLQSVDLSMGTLTAKGVEAIAADKAAFAHLDLLDISDNAIGDEAAASKLLAGVCKELKIEVQDPGRVEDEDYRYTAVGE